MKILLLNPALNTFSPNLYVPLGLCYVAASLEKAGYEVKIADMNVKSYKYNHEFDVVGITGMITEYENIRCLVESMSARGISVIMGGSLASCMPEKLKTELPLASVVVGEGESAVLKAIRKDGIFKEGITDIDSIPFPARHLLDMKPYLKTDWFKKFGINVGKIKQTTMITSRGCPYQCTYCDKGVWGNRWRGRSPKNILDEMLELYYDYGIQGFIFNDDTFVIDRKRVIDFCNLLEGNPYSFRWYCNGRIDLMDKEMLEAMYQAGCVGIAYGIESGNQAILDSIKKKITLEQIYQVIKWTKEAKIHATGYFMLGNLGETKRTIEDTIKLARDLKLDYYGFSLVTPFIGTELYVKAKAQGININGNVGEWSQNVNCNLTVDCSNEDLARYGNQVFREFFLCRKYGQKYKLNPRLYMDSLKSIRSVGQLKQLAKKAMAV